MPSLLFNPQVSFPKLKVSLALAGVLLTDKELHILQEGFRSDLNSDMVRSHASL